MRRSSKSQFNGWVLHSYHYHDDSGLPANFHFINIHVDICIQLFIPMGKPKKMNQMRPLASRHWIPELASPGTPTSCSHPDSADMALVGERQR